MKGIPLLYSIIDKKTLSKKGHSHVKTIHRRVLISMSDHKKKREQLVTQLRARKRDGLFVSVITAVCTIAFIAFTLLQPDLAAHVFSEANRQINQHFNWFYILVINVVLIFAIWLGLSKYGHIRLGGASATPAFKNPAW